MSIAAPASFRNAPPRRVAGASLTRRLTLAAALATPIPTGGLTAAATTPAPVTTPQDAFTPEQILGMTAALVPEPAARAAIIKELTGTATSTSPSGLDRRTVLERLAAVGGIPWLRLVSRTDPEWVWLDAGADPEAGGGRTTGVIWERVGARWFAREILAGSPAAAAGVLRGDELVTASGATGAQERADVFSPEPARFAGGLALTLRRQAGGSVQRLRVTTVASVADAVLQDLNAQPRLFPNGSGSLAVLRWPEVNDAHTARLALLAAARAEDRAEAVVLDLRGRTSLGGISTLFEPFVGIPDRDLPDGAGNRAILTRPMVVLVDGTTTGAHETLAALLRRRSRARLIGMPTAGHAAASHRHRLEAGGDLLLWSTVPDLAKGLSDAPLAPDLAVRDSLVYAGGRDPLLDAGLAEAARLAAAARTGVRTPPSPAP